MINVLIIIVITNFIEIILIIIVTKITTNLFNSKAIIIITIKKVIEQFKFANFKLDFHSLCYSVLIFLFWFYIFILFLLKDFFQFLL